MFMLMSILILVFKVKPSNIRKPLKVILKVLFYEAYCRGRALNVFEENSGINKVKINVFRLQIKVVKQFSKLLLVEKPS